MMLQSLLLASALIVNADFTQYFLRPSSEMNEAAMKAFIDRMAERGKVTHLFMNPVGQRASFKSAYWEPVWERHGEPNPNDRIGETWARNAKLCHDRGLDLYAIWIARCREKGISPWISMRMNDVHNVHLKDSLLTSRFWREHSELWRCPKADLEKIGWDWIQVAFDYGKEETRRHFLGAFRDLVDRYDADGYELDWMRFWTHLAPGREKADAHFLTEFMRDCRAYANKKARERGHPIKLSVRVHSGRKAADEFGLDPITWAKENLVDLVVPGNFWMSLDFTTDFVDWKREIAAANPKVKVIPSAADNVAGAPFHRGGQPMMCDTAILRGWSDLMNRLGADGLYFFNVDPETKMSQDAASCATAATIYGGGMSAAASAVGPRRYPAPFHDCVREWSTDASQLPKPTDAAGKVFLNVGTPKANESVAVILGFDADGAAFRDFAVTLNGVKALGKGIVDAKPARFGKAKGAVRYDFPKSAVRAGANEIAFAKTDQKAKVVWCELALDFETVRKPFAATLTLSAETVLENENVRLVFDDRGWVTSMREKPSGRELCAAPVSFVTARDKARWEKNAIKMEKRGENRYAWIFADNLGEAVFTVTPFDGGWTFKNETCTAKDCPEMEFCRLNPVCRKYDGGMANVLSDDDSAVMVRAYSVKADMGRLWVRTYAKPNRGLTGHAAGLYAGPRAKLIPAWKAMTLVADVPHSTAGGAWALESPSSNGSYLFSVPGAGTWPEWLELVRRGGFSTHHVICWGANDAYYEPLPSMFPGGRKEMAEVAENLHKVGKKFSIHTYTSALGGSKFVTPECDPEVLVRYSYTLAKPLESNDTEIVINEVPGKNHWLTWNYNGANALRIGTEIVTYKGVRREKPYGFTGIKRGEAKTTIKGPYPAGTRIDYLNSCFGCFWPDPDKPIADKCAAIVKGLFEEVGIDQIYFDASEGIGYQLHDDGWDKYSGDMMRTKFARAVTSCGRPIVIESSDWTPHSGWFHSRIGALDAPCWSAKRFHDQHVADVLPCQKANFIPYHLGWWEIAVENWRSPGSFLDETEYFLAKCAGWDTSMSFQQSGMGVSSKHPVNYAMAYHLTLTGWWEYARTAHALTEMWKEKLRVPGDEYRLRQQPSGVWTLAPATAMMHRVVSPFSRKWQVSVPAPEKAELRVQTLYSVNPYDSQKRVILFAASEAKKLKLSAAAQVTQTVACVKDAAHGDVLKVTAMNLGCAARGAWTHAEHEWQKFEGIDFSDRKILGAMGTWVKGDGSGALLNLQLRGNGAVVEQYVRLDFTGWRYFEFNSLREKWSDEWCAMRKAWPYGEFHSIFSSPIPLAGFTGLHVWLNDLPKDREVAVEIAEVRSVPETKDVFRDMSVALNGRGLKVPFEMTSGDYAEFADGAWTWMGANGEPKGFRRTGEALALKAGANDVAFAATSASNLTARANVTVFGVGGESPAFVPLTAEIRKGLSYEALVPAVYAPKKGLVEMPSVRVRPGETASLEVEIWGECANPTLAIGGTAYRFPANIGWEQHLVVRDGKTWQVLDAKHKVVASGELKLPVLSGGETKVSFACEKAKGDIRVNLVKIYRD